MYKILLVEDDDLMRTSLKYILEMDMQYQVNAVENCAAANYQNFCHQDLFILDIGLPDGNGIDLCKEIRLVTSRPILILTAYEEEEKVLRAFREGADDYVVKPFRTAELKARLGALLRRCQTVGRPIGYRSGNLCVSAEICEAFWKNVPITQFNRMEVYLLQILMRHQGRIVSRESVGQALWSGGHEDVEDNTLSVFISRLRKKLEQIGCCHAIETCWGCGYRWCLPVENIYKRDNENE